MNSLLNSINYWLTTGILLRWSQSSHGNRSGKSWKIQSKIHIFMWKVLNNGLDVYQNLSKFNNHIQNTCPLCNAEEQTIFHLFFKCQFSLTVFQQSPIVIDISNRMHPTHIIQNWLLHPDQGIIMNFAACIMWNIWKTRNDLIFNYIHASTYQCIQKALQDFISFYMHHALNYCSDIDTNQNSPVS